MRSGGWGRGVGGHVHKAQLWAPSPSEEEQVDFRQLWLLPLSLPVALATPLTSQASVLLSASTQVTVSSHCRGDWRAGIQGPSRALGSCKGP